VGHTEIIGMHDQELRVARVAESFGNGFGLLLTAGFNEW
jgi:hypothetical protein